MRKIDKSIAIRICKFDGDKREWESIAQMIALGLEEERNRAKRDRQRMNEKLRHNDTLHNLLVLSLECIVRKDALTEQGLMAQSYIDNYRLKQIDTENPQ